MGSNKVIILNTGVMYGKMLVSIFVTLYTSRVVLDVLGITDYGVYTVIGGVVTMLNFLNTSMASTTQRYITFELGKKVNSNVNKVFSASLFAHIGIAIIIFLALEIIGLWFFNEFINVPEDRLNAAIFVFHFSALTLVINLILVPYKALINAHEKMIIIATIDIIYVLLKLMAVFYLMISPFDKLKTHGINLFIIALLSLFAYQIISMRLYKDSIPRRVNDKYLFIEMISFSSYSLLGTLSAIGKNQGFAILINLYFGPALNAAYGIAYQVNTQLRSFANNIIIAVNPQLVKRYAANQNDLMMQLAFRTSKFAYFMLFLLASPIFYNIDEILNIWLKQVPNYANTICLFIIVNALIEVTAQPIMIIIQATGNIKKYQIVVGGLLLLNIPISFTFLYFGYNFQVLFIVNILISLIAFIVRLIFARNLVGLQIHAYYKKVLLTILFATLINLIILNSLNILFASDNLLLLFLRIGLGILLNITVIFLIGLTKSERGFVMQGVDKIVSLWVKKLYH